ncbi:DNA-directed RNA polymerase subunit A'' [Candidatus Marsarchaeota archaeon]|nr:DNA-directed RNA polymerase subunit A'' [Candidatus Marsarchaeota archaeon]
MAKKSNNYNVQYGEPVGMIAAQSVGEPGTQMILRLFHFAGIEATVTTSGLPRLAELVDAKKRPTTPITYVYIEDGAKKDFEKVEAIAKKINEVKMQNIVRRFVENFPKKRIKFFLNSQELEAAGLTSKQIASKIEKLFEVEAEAEEDAVTVRLQTTNMKIIRNTGVRIMRSVISGIEGVGKAIIQQDKKTGEYFIIATGNNLSAIMDVPGVDKYRLYTNDVFAMHKQFGIESARYTLAKELMHTLSEQSITVDHRHLLLIADAMTSSGTIKGIGRHGLSGQKNSVLARAAYEETVKHLINAAAFGEIDPMSGVTENILVGKLIPLGTGSVKLAMKSGDTSKVKKNK